MRFSNKQLFIKMLPMFMIGFVIFPGTTSSASGQGVINEILARMEAHNKALTSLRANVTMVNVNMQLGGVSETREGTVIYQPQRGKNPLVRVDWKSPLESISVVNDTYALVRHKSKEAIVGNTNDVKGPKGGDAFGFINMSRAQLKANYSVVYLGEATVSGGVKTWHLQMTPLKQAKYKSAEIWVDGNGMPIQSLIKEKNDDTSTVLLTNLQKNVRINSADFKMSLDGLRIIKS